MEEGSVGALEWLRPQEGLHPQLPPPQPGPGCEGCPAHGDLPRFAHDVSNRGASSCSGSSIGKPFLLIFLVGWEEAGVCGRAFPGKWSVSWEAGVGSIPPGPELVLAGGGGGLWRPGWALGGAEAEMEAPGSRF